MITPAQCRAARGLVNIDQITLADAASVSRSVIVDFESGRRKTIRKNLEAIQQALEDFGVEFIPDNGGGVMLAAAKAAVTPAQCRAARGLANIDQTTLAEAASISRSVIVDFENGKRVPHKENLDAIQKAFEDLGVEFIPENGGGPGLRLKK